MKRLMQAFWYCFVIGCVAGNCSAQSTDRDKPGQNWDPIRSANVQESHKEQPTDPPAKPIPRHLKRTSPAKNRGFGPFQSVQVNIDAGGNNILGDAANEPSIAINSTNPDNIVVGWRQFDNISSNFRQAGMAYSFDGGQSWSNEGPLEAGVFRSDPVLGFDSQGTIYYYSLTIDNNNFVCDMFLSSDGGQSWSLPIPAGGGDKQWFTVDRSGGKGNGHIYAYWSQSFSCCPPGFFTRSTDFSMTFLYPIELPL